MKTFFAIVDMKLLMWTYLRNLIGFWRGTPWVQCRHWSSMARWDLNENFTISSLFWVTNGTTLLMSISVCKGPVAVPDNNHCTLQSKMWTLVISYLLMSNVWLYLHMIPILCACKRPQVTIQYHKWRHVMDHLLIIKQPEHLGFKPLTQVILRAINRNLLWTTGFWPNLPWSVAHINYEVNC